MHGELTSQDFEAKAKEARIFLLCSPHNPLGIVWSREELTRNGRYLYGQQHSAGFPTRYILTWYSMAKKHIPTATLSAETAGRVISCISGTKTFNLAGLQASTTIFPNLEMKKKFDDFWMAMDIHRNNAFSSVAMEAAFNEGEEWLNSCLRIWMGTLPS